ncbi:hypothetical protein [Paenibacillus sp. MBLB4367]|uniref:hypothetical protein n=1 Tax=Paenibacillus sp. MBLB4367 TaxID=3384767 RepID=UPI00390823DE
MMDTDFICHVLCWPNEDRIEERNGNHPPLQRSSKPKRKSLQQDRAIRAAKPQKLKSK